MKISRYFKLPQGELRINIKSVEEINSLSELKTFVDLIADIDSEDLELLEEEPRRQTPPTRKKTSANLDLSPSIYEPSPMFRRLAKMRNSPEVDSIFCKLTA